MLIVASWNRCFSVSERERPVVDHCHLAKMASTLILYIYIYDGIHNHQENIVLESFLAANLIKIELVTKNIEKYNGKIKEKKLYYINFILY